MDRVIDYSKLRGRIKEKIGTEGEFARLIGRSANFVSKVFRNATCFSQDDICKIAEILDIQPTDMGYYFFVVKVRKSETT